MLFPQPSISIIILNSTVSSIIFIYNALNNTIYTVIGDVGLTFIEIDFQTIDKSNPLQGPPNLLMRDQDHPTLIEIQQSILRIRRKFPEKIEQIVSLLYSKFVRDKSVQPKSQYCQSIVSVRKKEEELSRYEPTMRGEHSDSQESKPPSIRSNHSDEEDRMKPPPFQRVQKTHLQLIKPTPTKYEVQEEFVKLAKQKQLMLSTDVYQRYGGLKKSRPRMQRFEKNYQQEIDGIIEKARQWLQQPNKEYRIYASKIAPRFHSREEEVRYHQKRLAAKAFCKRGYGLGKVKEEYSENGGPINMEKRRYKTVSTAFISQSYRRFEQFMNQDMKKSVRPLTGPEMRSLYSIFLNAQNCFRAAEYHCFRKCVKIAFDLGSVSLYEHDAINLFIAVLNHLKQKHIQGERSENDVSEYSAPVQCKIRPLNIYAPVEGGGYEQKKTQEMSVMSGTVLDDELTLNQQDFQQQKHQNTN